MASLSLSGYLGRLSHAWENFDGQSLANLLSFSDTHIANSKLQVWGWKNGLQSSVPDLDP